MANQLKYAFRLTHIENIPYILQTGLVRASSPLHNENYVSIGDNQVMHLRCERIVNGYQLSDFMPFYFGPRSPMLYVIQHGFNGVRRVEPEDIIYCVVRIDDLIRSNMDCIFTDGHALSSLTRYYKKENLHKLDSIVSYSDVYSTQWNSETDIDLKRRKEAELLVNGDLSARYIRGFVVYNEKAKGRLLNMGVSDAKIAVRPWYYF